MRWRTLVAGVLVLLLPLWDGGGSGGAGGELCGGWTDGGPDGAFYCPGLLDGADAKFCCGTCGAPYCCSSEAARLQHTQCAPSLDGSRAWEIRLILSLMMLFAALLLPQAVRYGYMFLPEAACEGSQQFWLFRYEDLPEVQQWPRNP